MDLLSTKTAKHLVSLSDKHNCPFELLQHAWSRALVNQVLFDEGNPNHMDTFADNGMTIHQPFLDPDYLSEFVDPFELYGDRFTLWLHKSNVVLETTF